MFIRSLGTQTRPETADNSSSGSARLNRSYMWGVAKIFTSGHSKGGFDRTPRTPLATGMSTSHWPQLDNPPPKNQP